MVQGGAGKPAFHVKSKRLSRSDCTRPLRHCEGGESHGPLATRLLHFPPLKRATC